MKNLKDKSHFLRYYHCYSYTISNVLDIPEIEILCSVRLLELQINYETNALSSTLYAITDGFVSNNCSYEKIKGNQILVKLTSIEDGRYCLLTSTKNLIYCEQFQRYPDILHFVTVEKKGKHFYIIDTFDGVDFYELVNIQEFDFTNSVLTILSLEEKHINGVKVNEIVNWYLENDMNGIYEKYTNYIKKIDITIDTVKSFTINGFLSSRLAFLYLLKEEKYITNRKYNSYSVLLIHKAEHIKLLLAKLQFRQTIQDMNKMIDIFYEFATIEVQIINNSQKYFR